MSRKLNNKWIFSDFGITGTFIEGTRLYEYSRYSIKDYGFDYEGYRLPSKAIGDISGYQTIQGFIDSLRNMKPGDRVSLLTHPIYWGEK